jgi:hypothetical protein
MMLCAQSSQKLNQAQRQVRYLLFPRVIPKNVDRQNSFVGTSQIRKGKRGGLLISLIMWLQAHNFIPSEASCVELSLCLCHDPTVYTQVDSEKVYSPKSCLHILSNQIFFSWNIRIFNFINVLIIACFRLSRHDNGKFCTFTKRCLHINSSTMFFHNNLTCDR